MKKLYQYLLYSLVFFNNVYIFSMENQKNQIVVKLLNSLRNPRGFTSYLDLLPNGLIISTAQYYAQEHNIIPHLYMHNCDCYSCREVKDWKTRYERASREQNWQYWKDSAFFALKTGGVFFIGCTAMIALYNLNEYEKTLAATKVLAQDAQPIQNFALNTAKAAVAAAKSATSYGFTFSSAVSATSRIYNGGGNSFVSQANINPQEVWQILLSRGLSVKFEEVCAMLNAGINPLNKFSR